MNGCLVQPNIGFLLFPDVQNCILKDKLTVSEQNSKYKFMTMRCEE